MSEFVEEFKIGNTNVKIAGDYCSCKITEDVNAISQANWSKAFTAFCNE